MLTANTLYGLTSIHKHHSRICNGSVEVKRKTLEYFGNRTNGSIPTRFKFSNNLIKNVVKNFRPCGLGSSKVEIYYYLIPE